MARPPAAFRPGPVAGVALRPLRQHRDDRGWLAEVFRRDEPDGASPPAMAYVSVTRPGVVRGPHEHRQQADRFCFAGPGRFLLVLWDARPDSPTRGNVQVEEVGEERPVVVVVPPGVVHAYRCLGPGEGWVLNLPDHLYGGPGRAGEVDEIRHEDREDSPFHLPVPGPEGEGWVIS